VYADWLQDRADPRAAYVRLKLELDDGEEPYVYDPQPHLDPLRELGATLNPGWVAFMETLAQPFKPIAFAEDGFTESIGKRGRVAVFESQYRSEECLNSELLADLIFLTAFGKPPCAYGEYDVALSGFLCELRNTTQPSTDADVRAALKLNLFTP